MTLTNEHRQILEFIQHQERISYALLARKLPPNLHAAPTDLWQAGRLKEYRPPGNPAAVYLELADTGRRTESFF